MGKKIRTGMIAVVCFSISAFNAGQDQWECGEADDGG